ncbi:MAG: metallophosphoesterase family protein [Acholeplasmataceae bacterium]|nr:metallophosphoesterase family protein [Acholeplasmataceae bacterium]
MKKQLMMLTLFALSLLLHACHQMVEDPYTDDAPLVMAIDDDVLNILQITDLHLTYGIDRRDQKTYDLIRTLVKADDYDLVVVTGDMMMSPTAVMLFRQFVNVMESLGTPWTFIFGNHDDDFHDKRTLLSVIEETEHLLFKVGPSLENGGYGNFEIQVDQSGMPFAHLYFFDTKGERKTYALEDGKYDYLSSEQVDWYENKVKDDVKESLAFMHIPLKEYADAIDYEGTFGEDKVYFQGTNTGLFTLMVTYGKTKGVFVGHDHLNDFSFSKDGILLAYGRATGYNGYGTLDRGGRVILLDSYGQVTSTIVTESEATT